MSTLTRARPVALVLAGLLLVCAGINNGSEFNQVTEIILARDRQQVLLPASNKIKQDQGYHRLGGSFSPPESSFAISFWIGDREGNLQTTSDNIAPLQIHQQLVKNDNQDLAGIKTKTDYYEAFWSVADSEKWQLHLKTTKNTDNTITLALRSIGATRGEVRSLEWEDQELLINDLIGDRWLLKLTPSLTSTKVSLGREQGDWIKAEGKSAHIWEDWRGLGYALFRLDHGNEWDLTIEKL